MKCKKHSKYKAKMRPRVDCLPCWEMYLEKMLELEDYILSKIKELKDEAEEEATNKAMKKAVRTGFKFSL